MKTLGIRHYSQIARRAAEKAKDKRPQFAQVVRVDGARVDLQVGQSSTVVKNVEVIGEASQLAIGDTVQISWWSQDRPVAVAGAHIEGHAQRITAVEDKLAAIVTTRPTSTPNPTGGIADWQILRFSGGALASVHDPTAEGLEDAMAVSASGDMVLLPSLDLEADFTIPSGVTVTGMSRTATVIRGTATLSERATLEKVHLLDTETGEAEAVAAIGSGTATIRDCDLWACNCGTGAASGVKVMSGTLTVSNASISGEAGAQPGYGVVVSGGRARLFETSVYGSTAQYSNDSSIYVHGTLLGEPSCECVDAVETTAGSVLVDGMLHRQIFHSFESGASLGDAMAFTEMSRFEVPAGAQIGGIGASKHNIFYLVNGPSANIGCIVRIALDAEGAGGMVDLAVDGEDVYEPVMVVIDERTAYAMYGDYSQYLVIAKYDLNLGTRSVLAEIPFEHVAFANATFGLDWCLWATRVKHASGDKLVFCSIWGVDNEDPFYEALRISIIDLANDRLAYDDFTHLAGDFNDLPSWQQFCTTPTVYQDKLVFSLDLDFDAADGTVCAFPTFVIDCSADSVTRVDDLRRPFDGWWGEPLWDAGIDRATGVYYLWLEGYDYEGNQNALVKLDLAAAYSLQLVAQYSFNCLLVQGKSMVYALQDDNGSNRWGVHSLPDLGLVGWLDATQGPALLDDVAGFVWQAQDTEINGIALDGGAGAHRPLDFNGSAYTYPNQRAMKALMIFDRKVLLRVYSKSDPYNEWGDTYAQHEYILLGE